MVQPVHRPSQSYTQPLPQPRAVVIVVFLPGPVEAASVTAATSARSFRRRCAVKQSATEHPPLKSRLDRSCQVCLHTVEKVVAQSTGGAQRGERIGDLNVLWEIGKLPTMFAVDLAMPMVAPRDLGV